MSYKLLTNLLFEPRGKHNPSLTYNIKDTVMSEDGSKVYFALDNVPAGIPLTDTNYWMLQMDLSASKNAMDVAAANARTQTDATIASANTRVEDMMGKAAEAVTSVADYAAKVGMRVKGETKITKGNPMTIYPDGGSLLKVQTDIPIKQLGEGDPYPAGAGKNLLPITAKTQTSNGVTFTVDNGVITANGTATANAYLWLCNEFTLQPGTYIMSGIPENFDFTTQGGFADDNWNINRYGVTTLTEAKKINPYIIIRNGVTANNIVFKLQLEAGSTATSYVPSSNIRPFVGYDELGLSVARKNLAPTFKIFPATSTGITVSESGGVLTVSGTTNTTVRMDSDVIVLPPGTYTLKPNHSATLNAMIYMRRLDTSNFGKVSLANTINAKSTFTITESEKATVSLFFENGAVAENISFAVMLNVGSEPAAFEPYKGSIHTVQLDKTIYQGHYDWMTGKFRAEWGVYTLTGDGSTKLLSASTYNAKCFMSDVIPNMVGDSTIMNGAKSSHFVEGVWNDIVSMSSPFGKFAINTSNKIGFAYDGTIDEANAWLAAQNTAGTPVQFVWKLATPIEMQLAPNVITAVEDGGVNHIYGDADLTVEWVKPLETSLTEHSNAKVDASNEALLMDVAQKERSVGNPVVINDAVANVAFPHVETEFAPKQSGSGDPYPAGGGKNLCSIGSKTLTYYEPIENESVIPAGTYTFSAVVSSNDTDFDECYVAFFDTYLGNTVGALWVKRSVDNDRVSGVVTLTADAKWIYLYASWNAAYGEGDTATFKDIQIELGSTATPYAPYSNIRPITGYDKLELMRCGKNLLNNVRYYDSTHTDIRAQYDSPLLLKAGVKYVLSTNFKADGLFFVDAAGNGSLEAQYLIKYQYDVSSLEYTPERDIECIFAAIFNSGVPDGATIQLEVGSATAHTPYQGALHTVQIGETVYGGRYNWLTGKLTKNVGNITLDGSQGVVSNWFGDHGNIIVAYSVPDALTISPTVKSNLLISDKLKTEIGDDQHLFESSTNSISMSGSSGCIVVCIRGITTLEGVHAWLSQNPVECVYPLATPIEIQLDPTRITTIPGTNTIFGDGEFTIDWFKSYKKIAEERENLLLDSFTDKAELSGNPIVMTPVGGLPFDSVVTEFAPKQAGSGDPYPAAGGRNLLNNTATTQTVNGVTFTVNADGTVTVDGTATANAVFRIACNLSVGETYTLSGCPSGGSTSTYFMQLGNFGNDTGSGVTAAATENTGSSVALLVMSGYTASNIVFKPQLELGSEATEFQPYSNIRPITGYDKMKLVRCGAQILDDTNLSGIILGTMHRFPAPFKVAGTYTVSVSITGGTEQGITFALRTATKNIKEYTVKDKIPVTIEVTDDILQRLDNCTIYTWSGSVGATLDWIMINEGSTALPYEPYHGTLHTVKIGQTVYGGRMDWLTGKLVAEWAMSTLTGDETDWVLSAAGNFYSYNAVRMLGSNVGYCSHYKTTDDLESTDIAISFYTGDTAAIRDRRFTNVDSWKAYLSAQSAAGNPVQIAYKLATPIEIQLTPTEIIALSGTNTLYGDGDTITAKFRQSKDVDILKRLSALETLMINQTKGE